MKRPSGSVTAPLWTNEIFLIIKLPLCFVSSRKQVDFNLVDVFLARGCLQISQSCFTVLADTERHKHGETNPDIGTNVTE